MPGAIAKGETRLHLLTTMGAFLTAGAPRAGTRFKQSPCLPCAVTVPDQSVEAHTVTRGTLPDLVQLPYGRAQL